MNIAHPDAPKSGCLFYSESSLSVLCNDEQVVMYGNTNGSYGYIYVIAHPAGEAK